MMPVSDHEDVAAKRQAELHSKRRVVKKKKKPPIPVPSMTIGRERKPVAPPRTAPGGKPRPHGGHLPTQYEYMDPVDFLSNALGALSEDDKADIRRQNQWREQRRRDDNRARRAAEKEQREQRRAAVRQIPQKVRDMIGRDKLNHWITTGEGMEPGIGDMLEAGIKGGAKKLYEYGKGAVLHPSQLPTDIYDAGDWWINKAPDKLLGKYEKGKVVNGKYQPGGYVGGAAEAWDKMSGEEQLDIILGGKSFTNALLHGDLDPENIGRAIALAAMVPFPFGKGLPSLATVLLRAGMSAKDVKIALTTGKGLKAGLEAAKTPVLTRAAAKRAAARRVGEPTSRQLERNLHKADADYRAIDNEMRDVQEQLDAAAKLGRGDQAALEARAAEIKPQHEAALAARREAQAAVRAAGGDIEHVVGGVTVRWPEPRRVRALKPEDADVIESWGGKRARRGFTVLSDAKKNRGPTVALTDEAGKLRAVAGFAIQDEDLVVTHLASEGKGGGIAMMRELATEADALGLGMKLVTNDADARAFYTKLGMHPQGEHGFSWSPEEVAEFADTPLPEPPADAMKYAREQGQETVYEYKTGDGIRTGLTRDEQAAIIERLRDEAGETVRGVQLPPPVVKTSAKQEYDDFLDGLVRASGKGKRGVTQKQRDAMEEETLKYANRYHDDPAFDEFWRLREAVNPTTSSDIPFGEAGFLDPTGFTRGPYEPRTIKVGERDVQLRKSHNRVVNALLERPVDWTSTKLASEESRAAAEIRRALGKIGLHPGARERGLKQLGTRQVKAASRRQARMMNYEQALPKYGSPADVAHFYWAQLPPDLRNLDGLQMVVDDLAREAEEITSGRMLERIKEQLDAVNAAMKNEDGSTNLAMLRDQEDLKLLAADLPNRLKDIAVKTAELQKTIKKAPKYDPKIIDAMRGLSEQRESILTRAGILKPEKAANRKGLYARHLGVPESGEEVYVGHRMGKVRGAQSSLMPVSPGVGRPMTPQGARSKNNLVLMRTGRVRASTHVAAEDWRAAETYDAALLVRDDLFSMGYDFTGRVPEGHALINEEGHVIPRHWKELPDLENLSDDEVRKIAEEVVQGFKAESPAEIDAMLEEAAKAGPGWEKRLRTIPKKDVDRYYGRFTPARGGGAVGKAYDSAIDFVAASLIFARVGYIPKNIVQNLIMATPHQGPFLLVNVPRAAEVLLDPDLRHFLHAEIGFSGKTAGIGEELRYGQKFKGLPRKVASMMGKIADDPLRMSAFLHEAAKKGVISKFSPHLTQKDKAALLKLLNSDDPKDIALLNDIADNAVGAMADFSRFSPTQRRTARRFLIIPGWLWAGTRLPVDFAVNYPVRTAAIGYVLAGEPYGDRIGLPQNDPIWDYMEKGVPKWAGGIHIPDSFPIFGEKTLRTGSISPVNTPYEIALALGGQSEDTPASYANPLAKAVWNIANRQVSYPGGTYQVGLQEAIIRNLERLLPNWTFVKQEIHPSGDGFYPEDESRLGRFFRELGVVPIKIIGETEKDTDDWVKEAEAANGGPLPQSVPGRVAPLAARKAYVASQEAEKEVNDENGIEQGGRHTTQERLIILIRTLVKLHPEKAAAAKGWEAQARGLSDEAAQAEIDKGRKRLGLTDYDRYQELIGDAKLNARTHTGMVNGGQHE